MPALVDSTSVISEGLPSRMRAAIKRRRGSATVRQFFAGSSIPYNNWVNFLNGKQRPTAEMIEQIGIWWPEEISWIVSGKPPQQYQPLPMEEERVLQEYRRLTSSQRHLALSIMQRQARRNLEVLRELGSGVLSASEPEETPPYIPLHDEKTEGAAGEPVKEAVAAEHPLDQFAYHPVDHDGLPLSDWDIHSGVLYESGSVFIEAVGRLFRSYQYKITVGRAMTQLDTHALPSLVDVLLSVTGVRFVPLVKGRHISNRKTTVTVARVGQSSYVVEGLFNRPTVLAERDYFCLGRGIIEACRHYFNNYYKIVLWGDKQGPSSLKSDYARLVREGGKKDWAVLLEEISDAYAEVCPTMLANLTATATAAKNR